MRKSLTALALGCVLAAALGVAATACEYHKQTAAASSAEQTAQAPATSASE